MEPLCHRVTFRRSDLHRGLRRTVWISGIVALVLAGLPQLIDAPRAFVVVWIAFLFVGLPVLARAAMRWLSAPSPEVVVEVTPHRITVGRAVIGIEDLEDVRFADRMVWFCARSGDLVVGPFENRMADFERLQMAVEHVRLRAEDRAAAARGRRELDAAGLGASDRGAG
ncbi:MAG: hypothetical protein AAF211_01755 [Myxococcota bacterium]